MDKKVNSIDEIIKWFDWEKVHKIMVATEWQWVFCDTEDGIPNIGMLMIQARTLMEQAINKKTTMGTGGFVASFEDDVLSLRFEIDSWNYDVREEEFI